MKPILILSNMYPDKLSPSHGIFVRNAEQLLLDAGEDVKRIVVAGRHANPLKKLAVYISFMFRALCVLMFTRRLIYIHFVAHSSVPLLLLSLFRRFEVVSHVHGGDVLPASYEPEWVRKVKKKLAARTLRLSKCIVVPSHYFKELVASEFDIAPDRIAVSPSGGVDTTFFGYMTPLHNDTPIFGYVGRLDKGKGVDTLLKALSLLQIDVKCQIVGTGSEAAHLQQLVGELGLADKVSFEGGKAQSDLPHYYQGFDWFVFPSEMQESLGLVGLEAMACGRPVIASMMAGMRDYMEPGKNALAFSVGDPVALAQAMGRAVQMPSEEYHAYCANAHNKALLFDAKVTDQGLQKILKEH